MITFANGFLPSRGLSLAHISRKELKKDEVRETFAHGAEAVMLHQQLTMWLVIAALAIGLGIFGWKTYSERQTVRASAAFDDAMKVFQARTISPGEPTQPGELTYTDDKVKFADAARKFGDVASKYSRTRPGQLAKYYEGLSFERIGKNDDAKKLFQDVASSGDDEFAAMAKLELASLDDSIGQHDEAVEALPATSRQAHRARSQAGRAAGLRRALQPDESVAGREILRSDQVRIPRHAHRHAGRTGTRAAARQVLS